MINWDDQKPYWIRKAEVEGTGQVLFWFAMGVVGIMIFCGVMSWLA